jgi:hypothetical protein
MANVNISQLPAVTTMKGTDEFPIGRDGTTTNKVTLDQIQNYLTDRFQTLNTSISATGTSIEFTGIPSTAKQVTVFLDNVSTSGSSPIQIQLGTSLGYTISGYKSNVTCGASTTSITSGIILLYTSDSTYFCTSTIDINLFSGFKYITSGTSNLVNSIGGQFVNTGSNGGIVTLDNVLDRIRITTVTGGDTFDSGTINIRWL